MQQIYRKFTVNLHPCQSVIWKKLLCTFIEIALRQGCSPVILLHIFRTSFLKNTFGQLLLNNPNFLARCFFRISTTLFWTKVWNSLFKASIHASETLESVRTCRHEIMISPGNVFNTVKIKRDQIGSSPPEVVLAKGELTGEHPCRSVISIKFLCIFIEIALRQGCSPVILLHIFRTPFLKNAFGQLLLNNPNFLARCFFPYFNNSALNKSLKFFIQSFNPR